MTIESGTVLAHYEVLSPLGKGGMGEVFRARDTKLGREVAIKILAEEFTRDPERLARFDREARMLASLNHPHVASIHGFEEAEGHRFLVMELAEGQTLADRIRNGPIPVDDAVAISRQIVDALENAHEKGIIHRDLKPANVVIDDDGMTKVLDFGLAKALDADDPSSSSADITNSPTMVRAATNAGVILGTAAYMSPEQAKGKRVDRRADIWSFGVVLFEMLAGKRLFDGETASEALASVIKDEIDFGRLPRETPPHVVRLLRRCLTKNPKNRLQAIGEARILLDDELRPVEPEIRQAGPIGGRSRLGAVLPWAIAVVLGTVLAAMLLTRRAPVEELVMADLLLPEGTTIQLSLRSPGIATVSPDGKKIAFVAVDENRLSHLYVRAIDEPSARLLPGTEGAKYPFWAPDSRFIGFFSDRSETLEKIDSSGGPPVMLCEARNGKGGTWNEDGIIVFTPDAEEGLYRVSAAGGEPKPLTTLDEGSLSHRHPRFLPDGNHFLYLNRHEDSNMTEIRIGSLDGRDSVVLLSSPTQVEYSAGHILFVRDGTLMAQPFDSNRRALSGEPVPVAEEITVLEGAAFAAFSASPGGVLCHTAGALASNEIELRGRDGDVLGKFRDRRNFHAVISPNGKLAALVDPTSDIWILDLEREVSGRFTFESGSKRSPVWSPDSRIVYYSGGDGRTRIFRRTVGGSSGPELVVESDAEVAPTGLSPDGRILLITKYADPFSLWSLDLEAGEPKLLRQSAFDEAHAVFSPDGRWIAYASDETDSWQVYVTSFPDQDRKFQISTTPGSGYPAWVSTPEGEEIVYSTNSGRLFATRVSEQVEGFVIEEPTMLPTAVLGWGTRSAFWSITPDGQKILLVPPRAVGATIKLTLNWPLMLDDD